MKKHKIVWLIFLAVFVLLQGCSSEATSKSYDQSNPIVLKYNDINSPESPQAMFGKEFAKLIEEKTKGRVKVETYFGGSLVGYDIEPVKTGIADFNQLIPSNLADLEKSLSILDAPYLYKDSQHLLKVVDPRSEILTGINQKLEGHGVRLITALPMGMRHITSNKEIKSVNDLKGLKIRVVPSQIYMDTISQFGAAPTPMPFSEVATSLTTGVIEGQENPFSVIVPNGLHDIQNYIAKTGHLPTLAGIFMNNNKFQSLTAEDKELLLDAATEARDKVANYISEKEAEWTKEVVDSGKTIIDENNGLQLKEFQEAGKKVHEKYKADWGELYNKVVEMGE